MRWFWRPTGTSIFTGPSPWSAPAARLRPLSGSLSDLHRIELDIDPDAPALWTLDAVRGFERLLANHAAFEAYYEARERDKE